MVCDQVQEQGPLERTRKRLRNAFDPGAAAEPLTQHPRRHVNHVARHVSSTASYQPKPSYYRLIAGLGGIVPAASETLFTNGKCDNGTTGWAPFGSGTLYSVPDGVEGAACGFTGRTATFNAPSENIPGLFQSGDTVSVNAFVRITNTDGGTVASTIRTSP